jgi:hypothetical protein
MYTVYQLATHMITRRPGCPTLGAECGDSAVSQRPAAAADLRKSMQYEASDPRGCTLPGATN